jgi:TetR/AcrR family transcriptional regulator
MENQFAQTKRSETAIKIIAAARDVFSERGFAATTVDEIARRAGVNKATLYYQIGNKETLYAVVIHDVMGAIADAIAHDIENTPSPEEKLKTYIRNVAVAVDRNPWMPPIMLREMAAGGKNLPEVVLRELLRIFSFLATIIDEGVRQGIFIAATPPLVHLMIMGAFAFYKASVPLQARQTWLSKEWKKGRGLVSEEIAGEVESLILRALKKVPRDRRGSCR